MANRNTTGSVTEKDFERISENLYQQYGDQIENEKSFNDSYDAYMDGENSTVTGKAFRSQVRKHYVFKFEAGGKSLKQDRQKTAQTVVTSEAEYIKRGAQHVDLAGLDDHAKKSLVTIRGKKQTKYRDARGRFTKKR